MQRITLPPGTTRENVEEPPGDRRGDCLRACFASIFELDLDEVPHFVAQDDWWGCLTRWLKTRNLAIVERPYTVADDEATVWTPPSPIDVPTVVTGPSPRGGGIQHAVVAINGQVVHDPHPSGAGLAEGSRGVYYLVALDPAQQPVLA